MGDLITPTVSEDAAIVLALADTAVPFAVSPEDEAERWVRVLRLHGQVGCAMQALGVGEAPLESPAQPRAAVRLLRRRQLGEDIVQMVAATANDMARRSGSPTVGTIHVLFAVLAHYGGAFDRALYVRGTTREELLDRLTSDAPLPQPPAV